MAKKVTFDKLGKIQLRRLREDVRLGSVFVSDYDRVGNWQEVKYSLSGRPFVTYRNKRYYLDTFYRIGSTWCSGEPFDIEDHAGRKATLHGYEMEEYYKPLFMQLSDDGERARLFRFEGVQGV